MTALPRQTLLWIVIPVVLVANLAWLIWFSQQRQHPAPTTAPIDITGHVPIQRARIDDFILAIQGESLEQSIDNLNFHEPLVLRAGFPTDGFLQTSPRSTQQCLANRRLARIFEEFLKLPDNERIARSMALFDKTLSDFSNAIDAILTRWENDNPPASPTGLFGTKRSLDGYSWAFCGSQLLCAEFCPLDLVLDNYARMRRLHDDTKSRVEKQPNKLAGPYTEIGYRTEPNLLHVNIARIAFERRFNVKDMDAFIPEEMIARDTPFLAWNAHTNEQDFTHQRRHVPADTSRILRTFSFYESWHPKGRTSHEARRPVLARCWEELKRRHTCAGVNP